MQERYVIGEIEADLYQKIKDKFSTEKEAIEAEIEKTILGVQTSKVNLVLELIQTISISFNQK